MAKALRVCQLVTWKYKDDGVNPRLSSYMNRQHNVVGNKQHAIVDSYEYTLIHKKNDMKT